VVVDDRVVAGGRAERDSAQLRRVGVGDGRHGFVIELPDQLGATARRSLDVRVSQTGERLAVARSYQRPARCARTVRADTVRPAATRAGGPAWRWPCGDDRARRLAARRLAVRRACAQRWGAVA
jgi:hypothetical protein